MTPLVEHYEKIVKECRESWFKDHVATILVQHQNARCCARDHDGDGNCDRHPNGTATYVINWQKPGTWIYGCRFVLHASFVTVMGDIGEAVYCWNEPISPQFLSGISFDYFQSKCAASEAGRKFEEWNSKVAAKYCAQRIAEIKAELPEDRGNDAFVLSELEHLGDCDKEEYESAARTYYDETGDYEGASLISEMGIVPSGRCIGHFIGLQMAIKQLKLD